MLMATLIKVLFDRFQRLRDEDGAISTTEVLIIVGVVVVMAAAVFGFIQQEAETTAENIDLTP
jgi:hypothetical protein